MGKILILDDDKDYCEEVTLALSREGHEVISTTSGTDAIEVGTLFRPDVLVTDWLLQESLDGLNVSEVLDIISPDLRTILITGFATDDLRTDAKYQEIFRFIEKPFRLSDIRSAVKEALVASKIPRENTLPIGIVEVDSTGCLIYSNTFAKELFALTNHGESPSRIEDIFDLDTCRLLPDAAESWLELSPMSKDPMIWNIRAKHFADVDSRLYVILTAKDSTYMFEPLLYRLLGIAPPKMSDLEVQGHLLVLDDYEQIRRVSAAILREFDCVCHTAKSSQEAIKIFERDPKIEHIILDCGMPESELSNLVKVFKERRPRAQIIGTSAGGYRESYGQLGIENFLLKPWSDSDLIKVIGAKKKSHSSNLH